MIKKTITGLIFLLVGGSFIWSMISFRNDKDRIDRLKQGEVKAIVVQDDSGREPVARFSNPEVISKIISSLQAGEYYIPAHDSSNEFELQMTLEPQGIKFTTYRHPRVPNAVVVSFSNGRMLCTPFVTWQPLEILLSDSGPESN